MRRPPMNAETLPTRYFDLHQPVIQLEGALEQAKARKEAGLKTLRAWAREDGLSKELDALENPPPVEERRPVALTRVRCLVNFSTEHERLIYAPVPSQVCDVPTELVRGLIKQGLVEVVDPATPTTRPQPVQVF